MDTRECSANLKSGSALHYTSNLPTIENIEFKEESSSRTCLAGLHTKMESTNGKLSFTF
jgi:hypothetical protein